jgi:peptidoglycan/LPS O-acetylase OafA/YrhL
MVSNQSGQPVAEIRSLTGLRGVAAWLVVVYHFRDDAAAGGAINFSEVWKFGYLAVDLFFILSGFVIYINYAKIFSSLNLERLKEFYCRRLARIYPLHIFMLTLFLINPIAILLFSAQGIVGERYDPAYFIFSVLLIQNWGFFEGLAWNVPAWSISTEFAAYLLFPFMAFSIDRLAQLRIWLPIAGLAGLPLLLTVAFEAANVTSLGSSISNIGIVRCVIEFALGMCLGYFYLRRSVSETRLSISAFLALPAFLGLCWILGLQRDYAIAPIAFCLLILGLADRRNWLARLLASKMIYFLGAISYSTYLVHYFVKDWIKFLSDGIGIFEFLLYIVVVFVSSVVLFYQVEQRYKSIFYQRLTEILNRRTVDA